jgi:hypothetical protein
VLGLLAVDLEMSELGIRQQPAVDKQRAADAGAERQQHDDAFAIATRTKGHLGDAGSVGVIEERDGRPMRDSSRAAAFVPIQRRSTFAAV